MVIPSHRRSKSRRLKLQQTHHQRDGEKTEYQINRPHGFVGFKILAPGLFRFSGRLRLFFNPDVSVVLL